MSRSKELVSGKNLSQEYFFLATAHFYTRQDLHKLFCVCFKTRVAFPRIKSRSATTKEHKDMKWKALSHFWKNSLFGEILNIKIWRRRKKYFLFSQMKCMRLKIIYEICWLKLLPSIGCTKSMILLYQYLILVLHWSNQILCHLYFLQKT